METKTLVIAAVVIAAIGGIAVAPTALSQAFADNGHHTTNSCTNNGGHTKTCGTPSANCETTTTKTGSGQGFGENKGSTTTCSTP